MSGASLWETDAANKVLKSSIRPNFIENRTYIEVDQQVVTLLKGFFQLKNRVNTKKGAGLSGTGVFTRAR